MLRGCLWSSKTCGIDADPTGLRLLPANGEGWLSAFPKPYNYFNNTDQDSCRCLLDAVAST